ncbi:MAG: hypothetical protein IT372_36230 [Polyangiaceae bacterium]|nr:hypothetical protein [Polyangiaceae bacterium]
MLEPLILLAEGRPAGVALAALLEACRQEEQALLEVYAMEAYSGAGLSAAERARADERRAQAWLGRQDLRSYLLLGDPAARLGGSSGRERA